MSLYQTETDLKPLAIHCAVTNESFSSRSLVVKPAANSNGYTNLAWREAYRGLLRDEQSGWLRAVSLNVYGFLLVRSCSRLLSLILTFHCCGSVSRLAILRMRS